MQFIKKSPKLLLCIIGLFSILVNITKSEDSCPIDKPILKNGQCQDIYCTESEFSSEVCKISNHKAKVQWLNNLHMIEEDSMKEFTVTNNYKGELFLSFQKVKDKKERYCFGFNSEGEGLFLDKSKDKYTSYEVLEYGSCQVYYDYFQYIEIEDKSYLFSGPKNGYVYLFDYINNERKQFFLFPDNSKSCETVFQMKNSKDMFFTTFSYTQSSSSSVYYLDFQKFKLTTSKLEKVKDISKVSTISGSRPYCNQNEEGYIFCFYLKKEDSLNFYLSVINPDTIEFEDTLLIEENFPTTRIFDEVINLKNDLYILAHSIEENVIKVEFKKVSLKENSDKILINYEDYFSDIPQIIINKEKIFRIDQGTYKKNDLYKINDNKFAIFLREFTKDKNSLSSVLLIYIFSLYNNDKNISVRRYSINFSLYNRKIKEDIRGFNLGDFLGIATVLVDPSKDYLGISSFITFGYVNTTEQEGIDGKLKFNNANSKIIISQYINEIENNLFGYTFLGAKILSLPSEADSGYFIYNITNNKIKKDDIVSRESELRFVLNNNFKVGTYEIQFQVVVKEPEYEYMNVICEEVLQYPEGNNVNEKDFYKPKQIFGKKLTYKFSLSYCYDSCEKCTSISEDDNDHKCITCKEGYYFKEGTQNCYNKIDSKFYFDKEEKIFKACHENCLTCYSKPNGQKEMNCLTCDNGFKFYNKSNNCLNCENYVNLEQTECLQTIPEGYFLEDKDLKSLGKCHFLCKTCESGPYINTKYSSKPYYQNCKTCFDGTTLGRYDYNCSYSGNKIPDFPVNGECPLDKPIFKNGKCSSIYCTNSEFKNEICILYNPIMNIQWLNNFYFFSGTSSSSVSIADDIITNQKIILFAQNLNRENGYIEKYMYGFYMNGTGIFYNKNKNTFESFKKMDFTGNGKLIDKISYIEMNNKGYLLTAPIENNLYIIDYTKNLITKNEIDIPAYTTDKIILLEKDDKSNNQNYLSTYIYCKDKSNNDCYLMMKKFIAEKKQLKQNLSMKANIKVHYNSQLNCYKDENNYIRCIYNKYVDDSCFNHVLGIYDSESFNLLKEFELENNFDNNPTFDSMIRLKEETCIIAYSTSDNKNRIKILIKKINYSGKEFSFNDYIEKIPEILLNEDDLYIFEGGEASSNSLFRFSDDKFALLVNDFTDKTNNLNSKIVIFILSIYNSYSKVNIRHYTIDFSLYNFLVNKKIIGYNLNEFFGILIELTSPDNTDLKRASFLTFGYINSTDIEPIKGSEILRDNDNQVDLQKYINNIENNLFGYKLGNLKVISVPNSDSCGTFKMSRYSTSPLVKGDLISVSSKIYFVASKNPQKGNYSLVLAPIIEEQGYSKINSYCRKLETYPKDVSDSESSGYNDIKRLGKYFSFNFYLDGYECYQNCETCEEESKDENDQKCKECKINFIKVEGTKNCIRNTTNSEQEGEGEEDQNKEGGTKDTEENKGETKGTEENKGDGIQTDGNNGNKGGAHNLNSNLVLLLALSLLLL